MHLLGVNTFQIDYTPLCQYGQGYRIYASISVFIARSWPPAQLSNLGPGSPQCDNAIVITYALI